MRYPDDDVVLRFVASIQSLDNRLSVLRELFDPAWSGRVALTPRTVRAILDAGIRSPSLTARIAKYENLRAEPDIRTWLLKSNSKSVLLTLLKDRRPEEFRPLFRKLARVSPSAAAQILADFSDLARNSLRAKDVMPLLLSQDSNVRMTAITAIPDLPAETARIHGSKRRTKSRSHK